MRFKPKKHFEQELEKVFEDGEVIVAENEERRDLFVIQEGRVAVFKKIGKKEVRLATMEKGDFFGEMSLLESEPRSATVRAVGRTKVLAIQPGGFLLKIRRDPTFAFEIMQRLSGRVRAMNEKLAAALESAPSKGAHAARIITETEYMPKGKGEGEG
ncbi:MAG: cyclic nucleotide-binding domain-containing protein [Alphaproteobacteria bacterium]